MYTLKYFYHKEILGDESKPYSWFKVLRRAYRSRRYCYLFWFRIAYCFYEKKSSIYRSLAKKINQRLINKYSVEIMLGAKIDKGLSIGHACSIVVTKSVEIGKNFTILQNTTIGSDHKGKGVIKIGDNVWVGANSCIIGSGITIGHNVTVGAMSFINKDVPDNVTYITEKHSKIVYKKEKNVAPIY